MKRSRFSEEQIIGILAEQESGMKVSEVCRKHGMSDATFYKWKSQFGGMTVSEAKRLKGLESENTELRRWWRSCRWTSEPWRRLFEKSIEALSSP